MIDTNTVARTRLLSTPEVSEQTGIPVNQVRNLIEAGKLPAINISTGKKRPKWAVRQCDLEAFLTPTSVRKKEKSQQRRRAAGADVPKRF